MQVVKGGSSREFDSMLTARTRSGKVPGPWGSKVDLQGLANYGEATIKMLLEHGTFVDHQVHGQGRKHMSRHAPGADVMPCADVMRCADVMPWS